MKGLLGYKSFFLYTLFRKLFNVCVLCKDTSNAIRNNVNDSGMSDWMADTPDVVFTSLSHLPLGISG